MWVSITVVLGVLPPSQPGGAAGGESQPHAGELAPPNPKMSQLLGGRQPSKQRCAPSMLGLSRAAAAMGVAASPRLVAAHAPPHSSGPSWALCSVPAESTTPVGTERLWDAPCTELARPCCCPALVPVQHGCTHTMRCSVWFVGISGPTCCPPSPASPFTVGWLCLGAEKCATQMASMLAAALFPA